MKEIKLPQGKVALVDDDDFDYLNQFKWQYNKYRGYASRTEGGRLFRKDFYMHREIMNAPKGVEIDHIDGNKLNNQKSNLRFCTGSQNHANMPKLKYTSTSPYKGVSFEPRTNKWRCRIKVNRKDCHIGTFADPIDAAIAYDKAAVKYFGEYARLNFPDGGEGQTK